jgi:hypothetical protein
VTVHSTFGPASGQDRSSPFSGEIAFLSGPRYCGQSARLLQAATIKINAINVILNFIILLLPTIIRVSLPSFYVLIPLSCRDDKVCVCVLIIRYITGIPHIKKI